jgi:hypothetical protein
MDEARADATKVYQGRELQDPVYHSKRQNTVLVIDKKFVATLCNVRVSNKMSGHEIGSTSPL